MSNAAYAAELGNAFLTMFAATRSRKRKKRLAKDFFDTLEKDTVMKELIVEYGKNTYATTYSTRSPFFN
jgi:hypothetical protein